MEPDPPTEEDLQDWLDFEAKARYPSFRSRLIVKLIHEIKRLRGCLAESAHP